MPARMTLQRVLVSRDRESLEASIDAGMIISATGTG